LLTLNEVPQENKVHSVQKSNAIILAVKKLYKQYDQFLAAGRNGKDNPARSQTGINNL